MNNEEMVQEKQEKQLHFFDRLWPKRTLALILGLSMIATLIVPAAFRANREEAEETEVQSEQPQSADARENEPSSEAASSPDTTAEPIVYHDDFLTYYELCTLAKSQGDYASALTYAEQCLAVSQTREETVTALAEKGDVLFAMERYGEAKETYRQIADWDAEDLISLYALNSKLARCQLLDGELEDSLMSCNLALEQAEDDTERAEILALRGVVLYYGGAFEEAKADFEAANASGYEDPELLRTQIEQCEQQLASASGAGAGTGTAAFTPAGTQSETAKTETAAPEPTEGEQNAAVYYFGGQYAQAEEEFRKLLGKSYSREKYEPYLSARATAYLFVLERYFLELALFLKSHQCFYRMNYIAALTWGDVQKMQRDFDDYIIKEINSPRHYLESKNSSKYKLLTRIYKKKYITKSVLMQFSADEKMCDLLASEETENYEIVKRAYELVLKKQLPVESN